jgi:hypothetical protein
MKVVEEFGIATRHHSQTIFYPVSKDISVVKLFNAKAIIA